MPARETAAALWGRKELRFALRYAAISATLLLVYFLPYEELGIKTHGFESYLAAYARLAGWVLHLFDPSVSVSGSVISGRYSLQIVKNCDAIEVKILLTGAILALPAPLKQRFFFLLLAILLLVVANITRICALYWLGVHSPDWFEFEGEARNGSFAVDFGWLEIGRAHV